MVTEKRPSDRRVRRTERRLHEALATLVHEKAYDAIAVKEILHRADEPRRVPRRPDAARRVPLPILAAWTSAE